jgi:hypothetical protein
MPLAQWFVLHKPFGVQSWITGVAGCDDRWRISTIERRSSAPMAVRCIDGPMGTMTGAPPYMTHLHAAVGGLQTGLAAYRSARFGGSKPMYPTPHHWR